MKFVGLKSIKNVFITKLWVEESIIIQYKYTDNNL